MSMTPERIAEVYESIRRDVMLRLQWHYACSIEDALDATQQAVAFLLARPGVYAQLDDDNVARRLRIISTRIATNGYKANTRRVANEQRFLKRRDMQE